MVLDLCICWAGPVDSTCTMKRFFEREAMVLGLLGVAVFCAIAWAVRSAERSASARYLQNDGAAVARFDQPGEVARVERALKAMQLVAVVIETSVTSVKADESWRGDVTAKVTVPVRLLFGSDLEHAKVSRVELGPLGRSVQIVAPVPKRLGAEIDTVKESTDLSLGWLRFRTRAGEYTLGQARKGLSTAVDELTLSADQQQSVREQTRERIRELLLLCLTGEPRNTGMSINEPRIEVLFEDELGGLLDLRPHKGGGK